MPLAAHSIIECWEMGLREGIALGVLGERRRGCLLRNRNVGEW